MVVEFHQLVTLWESKAVGNCFVRKKDSKSCQTFAVSGVSLANLSKPYFKTITSIGTVIRPAFGLDDPKPLPGRMETH